MVTHFRDEAKSYVQAVQLTGGVLGGFCSVSVLLLLNDPNLAVWFNLAEEEGEVVILTHSTYLKLMGAFSFVVATWILISVEEKEIEKTKKTSNLCTSYRHLKQFCVNPVLKKFSLLLLTQRLGFAAFNYLFITILLFA